MAQELLKTKEETLICYLSNLESVMVAYSGGVDSSLLSYYARKALVGKAKIVIAVSPSLATRELEAARQQAKLFAWDLIEIETNEVSKQEYQRNDSMRCYYCKQTLFVSMERLSKQMGILNIAYGANLDDLSDFRPGHLAAKEFQVHSPLQNAGLTKEEIRELARAANLPSWDRPQAACLSSRFPELQPVTISDLLQVERAEEVLLKESFRQVRVRHLGQLARIEVGQDEVKRLLEDQALVERVTSELKRIGYSDITIERAGYKQGGANL